MIDVEAFVTLADVEKGLRRMLRAGHDLKPVFLKARKVLRADQADHVKAKRGPDGPWAALSPRTIEARRQRAGKQGRRRRSSRHVDAGRSVRTLGRLPRAYSIAVTATSIKATSRVPWSGAHNDPRGARVGRGRRVRLRGRPFLWLSTGLLGVVSRLAMDYLLGVWEKGT